MLGFSGTPKDMGPPKMVSGTHTIPISLGILMGIVWEAYHKGVPLLGVPGITLDKLMLGLLGIYWSNFMGNICRYFCWGRHRNRLSKIFRELGITTISSFWQEISQEFRKIEI